MAKSKSPIDKLKADIAKILAEYEGEITESMQEVTAKVAKKGAQALQRESKEKFGGTGQYAKGWKVETNGKAHRQLSWTSIIYNETPGLPHLLENGHAKRGGGRVEGRPHIEPVEQEIINEYETEVLNNL